MSITPRKKFLNNRINKKLQANNPIFDTGVEGEDVMQLDQQGKIPEEKIKRINEVLKIRDKYKLPAGTFPDKYVTKDNLSDPDTRKQIIMKTHIITKDGNLIPKNYINTLRDSFGIKTSDVEFGNMDKATFEGYVNNLRKEEDVKRSEFEQERAKKLVGLFREYQDLDNKDIADKILENTGNNNIMYEPSLESKMAAGTFKGLELLNKDKIKRDIVSTLKATQKDIGILGKTKEPEWWRYGADLLRTFGKSFTSGIKSVVGLQKMTGLDKMNVLGIIEGDKPVKDRILYKIADAIDSKLENTLNDPNIKETFGRDLWGGAGSLLSFAIPGGIASKIGFNPTAVNMTLGALMNAGDEYDRVLKEYGEGEKATQTLLLNAGLGLTEAISITKMLGRLGKLTGKSIYKDVGKAVISGWLEEGGQELFQQVGQMVGANIIGTGDYKPEEILSNGLYAGLLGGILGSGMNAITLSGKYKISDINRQSLENKLTKTQKEGLKETLNTLRNIETEFPNLIEKDQETIIKSLNKYGFNYELGYSEVTEEGEKKINSIKINELEVIDKAYQNITNKEDEKSIEVSEKQDKPKETTVPEETTGENIDGFGEQPQKSGTEGKTPVRSDDEKKTGLKSEIESLKQELQDLYFAQESTKKTSNDPDKLAKLNKRAKEITKRLDELIIKGDKKASTQVNIPKQEIKPFVDYANSIPEQDIYDEEENTGRETEPHITALYGLKTNNPEDVQKIIEGFGDVEITLGETSLFENDNYDVLKVDVESPQLREINKKLSDSLEYENDYSDEYIPHLTIAYLKKGEGQKYVGDQRFKGQKIKISELMFSNADRNITPINLSVSEASKEKPITEPKPAKSNIIPRQEQVKTIDTKNKYKKEREQGYKQIGEKRYFRQNPEEIDIRKGKDVEIRFTRDRKEQGYYAAIPINNIQASHLSGGSLNPLHFITEGQPKNRGSSITIRTEPMRKATNLDANQLGISNNAYFGTPVINEYGEVIQGNGRTQAIKEYFRRYKDDPKKYTEYINSLKEQTGIEIAPGMILVRVLPVSDETAIEIGNYSVDLLEDSLGHLKKLDKSAINRLTSSDVNIIKALFNSVVNEDQTLKDLIRNNAEKIVEKLQAVGAIREDETEKYLDEKGNITADGINNVYVFFKELLFKGGDIRLSELFDKLPHTAKNGIEKSILNIVALPQEKSLQTEVQNATIGYLEFLSAKSGNKILSVPAWLNQPNLEGEAAADRYSEAEQVLINIFDTAKKQSEITDLFKDYNGLVKDTEEDLFNPAKLGLSKQEAINQIFNKNGKNITGSSKEDQSKKPTQQKGQKQKHESGDESRSDKKYLGKETKLTTVEQTIVFYKENKDRLIKDYLEKYGNVVSQDYARYMFENVGYNKLDTHSSKMYSQAAWMLVEDVTNILLERNKNNKNEKIAIIAGGTGSGKTTYQEELKNHYPIIFDTNISNYQVVSVRIDKYLKSGYKPTIIFVSRHPYNAYFDGILKRLDEGGHLITVNHHIHSHQETRENLIKLNNEYGDKINFIIYDSGEEISIEKFSDTDYHYNEIKNKIENELKDRVEKQILTEEIYESATGRSSDIKRSDENDNKESQRKGQTKNAETKPTTEVSKSYDHIIFVGNKTTVLNAIKQKKTFLLVAKSGLKFSEITSKNTLLASPISTSIEKIATASSKNGYEEGYSVYQYVQSEKYVYEYPVKSNIKKTFKTKEVETKIEVVDKEINDLWDEFGDEFDKTSNQPKAQGIDVNPKLLEIGTKIVAAYINKGIYKLEKILLEAYQEFGEQKFRDIFRYIKGAYNNYKTLADDETADKMDSFGDVNDLKAEDIIESIKDDSDNRQTARDKKQEQEQLLRNQKGGIDQTETKAFKEWFRESKVVDKNGNPLRVYHGTGVKKDFGIFFIPAYFSESPEDAERYANEYRTTDNPRIYPVYLSIQKPIILLNKEITYDDPFGEDKEITNVDALTEMNLEHFRQLLPKALSNWKKNEIGSVIPLYQHIENRDFISFANKKGYDGIILEEQNNVNYMIFSQDQVKSAIGNRGIFDSNNPDIRKQKDLKSNNVNINIRQQKDFEDNEISESTVSEIDKALKKFGIVPSKEFIPIAKEERASQNQPKGTRLRKSIISLNKHPEIAKELKSLINNEEWIYYTGISNAQTIDDAVKLITDKGIDVTFTEMSNSQSKIEPRIKVAAGIILARLYNDEGKNLIDEGKITEGNAMFEKSSQVMHNLSPVGTTLGQGVQAFAIMGKWSAENWIYQANKSLDKSQAKEIEEAALRKKLIKQIIDEINSKALENISKDLLPKQIKAIKNNRQKDIDKAAKRLANRIRIEPKPNDPINYMVNTLFKIAKENGLIPAELKRIPQNLIEQLGTAIKDSALYEKVWDKAKRIVLEKFKGNQAALIELDDYFAYFLEKPFTETQIKAVTTKGIKEMGTKIYDIVKRHYSVSEAVKKNLIEKLINEAGLTQTEATQLRDNIAKKFEELTTTAKQKILNSKLKNPLKILGKNNRELHKTIIELSNLGALQDEELTKLFADKFKIIKLSGTDAKKIYDMANDIQETPEGFTKREKIVDMLNFIENLNGIKKSDVLWALWYSSILSGISTTAKNITYNTLSLIIETLLRNPKEYPLVLSGLIKGIRQGIIEATDILKRGKYTSETAKFVATNVLERNEFKGGLINPINYAKYVSRFLIAQDRLFYNALYESEISGLAYSIAKSMGLTGKALAVEVGKLLGTTKVQVELAEKQAISEGYKGIELNRRTYEIINAIRETNYREEADLYAARGTLNYKPRGIIGNIVNAIEGFKERKGMKWINFIIPFTRIVSNVTNNALDFTPLGIKRAVFGYTGEGKMEGREYSKEMSRAIFGTTAMIGLYALSNALNGDDDDDMYFYITGNGYNDYRKNTQLMQTGWRPYSFYFKGRWTSYINTPFAIPFLLVGHYNDFLKYRKESVDEEDLLQRFSGAAVLSANAIMSQSFLSGLNDFMTIFDKNNPEKAESYLTRLGTGVIGAVIPNLFKQLNYCFDDSQYDPEDTKQMIIRNMGIAETELGLKKKINVLGEEIKKNNLFLPSEDTNHKVWKLIIKNSAFITTPREDTFIYDPALKQDRLMTPDEYYRYVKESGQIIKNTIENNYKSIASQENSETIRKRIKDITAFARETVKQNIALGQETKPVTYPYKFKTTESDIDEIFKNAGLKRKDNNAYNYNPDDKEKKSQRINKDRVKKLLNDRMNILKDQLEKKKISESHYNQELKNHQKAYKESMELLK